MPDYDDLDAMDEKLKIRIGMEQAEIKKHEDKIARLVNERVAIEMRRMERRQKQECNR